MSEKVKFGIVGVGSRGLHAFGRMICDRRDAEVAAMCDTNRIRMEAGAARLNITPNFYGTITDMVKHEKLDAVVITTPDFYHEQCAVEALEAGVNVLIDKPLATSVKGCRHIIATAEKTGKTVMIGFNLRHNAVLKKLKKIVSEGTLGKVFLIENREFYDGGRTYMSRWNRSYEFCGGLWIHKGSHDFDVFQWLLDFPKPVKVSSFAGINVLDGKHIPFEQIFDTYAVRIIFEAKDGPSEREQCWQVFSLITGSQPSAVSCSQKGAVRRHCHTMALYTGLPVSFSQTTVVSRWLVMPMAAIRAACRGSPSGHAPPIPAGGRSG